MIAFVIANGTSRLGFDLRQLKDMGTIYGCNALYREYASAYEIPDILVAIDDGMIDEILNSDFPKSRFIAPLPQDRWEPKECNPNQPRSNAGMNAMIEAIKMGATTIIGLGFDFMLIDRDQSISNIYDGSNNYGMTTRAQYNDNFGRARYLNWLAEKNPNIDFMLCYKTDAAMQRVTAGNISTITYDQLMADMSHDSNGDTNE